MDLYLQIFVSYVLKVYCCAIVIFQRKNKRQIERTDKDARELSMVSARARIVD